MSTDEPMVKDINSARSISELMLTSRSVDGNATKSSRGIIDEGSRTPQPGFKIWNARQAEKRNRHPCTKSVKQVYISSARTTIQEVECRAFSIYCASDWTECKPNKAYSSVAKRIITTSCECKP